MRAATAQAARTVLGVAAGVLVSGVLAGAPVVLAAGAAPGAAVPTATQPTDPMPTASEVAAGPASVWPTAWAGPAPAATGRSLVRRRDPPDHYTRPPDVPYRSFTLAATGDLLIHTPVWQRAATADSFDFAPQLAAARADVAGADLAVCHLEVPLDPEGPYRSYPLFNAPAELADGIAATGWDVCSTASNHSADQGFEGLVSTLDALDAAGVAHRGMFRSPEEAAATPLLDVDGVAVGLLSATYGLNGLPPPGGHEWSVQRIDVPVLLDRSAALRQAGAEVVVLALHWGEEYRHAPTDFQRTVAGQLLDSGLVDAIVGHHSHVIQPVEWIRGRPVVYGLGNFLSGQRPTERRDGAVVVLEFTEDGHGWSVEAVHAQPTWVDDAYAVAVADPDAGGVLGASAQRTLGHLGVAHSPDPPPPRLPPNHYDR